ncbi:PTS sugar transporter subunit IIA [Lactobacillus agrestimuris]|uniref:PTS sugar transporter subunit IIA n=1 Tax=Lactobacillus agrestimuris TaxID=2941328 RepID=UPI002043CE62|nr:PTS sugar transporter subunit IIA [Lactobacillus agrestimuris]
MRDESIFASDAVYVSSETDQALLLKEIYDKLLEHGYVKGDFLAKIIQREEQFPTGLSMKTLGKDLPNIAIPHTEGKFVNARLIVPVALVNSVEFGNMVNPKEKLSVKFLFMLLENNPDGQAKLLSQVMDFLADTPEKQLKILFNLHDPETIYEFLRQKFTK